MGKIYSFEGREVLLSQQTCNNSKFNYKVEAVIYRNGQILLNLNFLNRIVEQEIHRSRFSFLGDRKTVFHEKIVNGYKSDLYIADTNTLIEIKSVLAFSDKVDYPVNYSSHMLRQLEKLQDIANSQVNVYYFIIGLGPALKEIDVDINSKYGKLMDKCKRAVVQFIAMNPHNRKGKYRINEFVNINYIAW